MGNAAAVLSGAWGAVTRRSEHRGESRTAISTHAERVVPAVASAQASGSSEEALWAPNERLRVANEALGQAWSAAEARSEAPQRARASAGSARGLRVPPSVIGWASVLPRGVGPRRAPGGRWVPQSAAPSRRILRGRDRAGQRWVLTGGLEARLWPRAPRVMAVEPVRLAWCAGQRGPDRTGARWGAVGAPWPALAHVMADGGPGRAHGVQVVQERRHTQAQGRDAAPRPASTRGLDVVPTQRARARVVQRQGNQAERPLELAREADAQVAQETRRGREARGGAGRAGRAWRKAERRFDAAVQAEEAVPQVETALGWGDAAGPLLRRGEAQAHREQAREQRSGSPWHTGRRLLQEARTLRHGDGIATPRAEGVPEPMRRESLPRVGCGSARLKPAKDAEGRRWRAWVAMAQGLCSRLCPQGPDASGAGHARLRQAVRASRAVEGGNSVVRRQQGRHRSVRQGRLDLKRLYGHGRVLRDGKRKGRSPDDLLGLPLPTSDWWQLLQMDPEE